MPDLLGDLLADPGFLLAAARADLGFRRHSPKMRTRGRSSSFNARPLRPFLRRVSGTSSSSGASVTCSAASSLGASRQANTSKWPGSIFSERLPYSRASTFRIFSVSRSISRCFAPSSLGNASMRSSRANGSPTCSGAGCSGLQEGRSAETLGGRKKLE